MKSKGFTLLEVLLSVAIVSVIFAAGAPIYFGTQKNQDLNNTALQMRDALYRAELLSEARENSGSWGVYIEAGQIVLFSGSSYASRDVGFDEVYPLPNTITISGDQEYIFSETLGELSSSGTTTLTTSTGAREVSVNEKGLVTVSVI